MNLYRLLADAVVLLHFAYVAFVVIGMVAILAGSILYWQWVRNFYFRAIHFLMIAVVVAESLCGVLCPLTEWEDCLRKLSGKVNTPGSFIGRWIDALLFVNVSPSVLSACYCLFAAIALLAMLLVPPRWPWKKKE